MIFCAEIGSNHKGIPALAFEMIRQAKWAGADIAKFQLGHPQDDVIRGMPNKYAHELMGWCQFHGIEFMASLFSRDAIRTAREIKQRRYKLASRVAFKHHSHEDYDQFFATLLEDGKEIFVSDGTVPDAHGVHKLWCVAQYPTYPEDMIMPQWFGNGVYWWGYSGHLHGYADALIAIARGAQYIEKHVTLDKTEESIKDNHFALSFDEFGQMVDIGREMGRLVER